jgi:hypothetical protein
MSNGAEVKFSTEMMDSELCDVRDARLAPSRLMVEIMLLK